MSKFNESYNILTEIFMKKAVYATGRSESSLKPSEIEAKTLDMAKSIASKRKHDTVYVKLSNGKWEAVVKTDGSRWLGIKNDTDITKYREMTALSKHIPKRKVISEFIKEFGSAYKEVTLDNSEINKIEKDFNEVYNDDRAQESPKFKQVSKLKNDEVKIDVYIIQYTTIDDNSGSGPDQNLVMDVGYHLELVPSNKNSLSIIEKYGKGMTLDFSRQDQLVKFFTTVGANNLAEVADQFSEEDIEDLNRTPKNIDNNWRTICQSLINYIKK